MPNRIYTIDEFFKLRVTNNKLETIPAFKERLIKLFLNKIIMEKNCYQALKNKPVTKNDFMLKAADWEIFNPLIFDHKDIAIKWQDFIKHFVINNQLEESIKE